MRLSIVGLNHRRAPVEVREKLAFDGRRLPEALQQLRQATGAVEAVILSTCNRVEIYAARNGNAPVGPEQELDQATRWLAAFHGVPEETVRPALYLHDGIEAVRHLYRVSSGLDAMVLGETQILAQVKDAYQAAKDAGHTGRVFNTVFQRAFRVAKLIHATTAVGAGNTSVASVAARLAEKVFQDLAARHVMIVGAGETGELTLGAFRDRGASAPVVVNRTLETARRVAEQFSGRAVPLDQLAAELHAADVVITCMSVTEHHLLPAMVTAALRARRGDPMVLLDLGVPRNIHPDVNNIENAYLFNIDDLERIVAQNLAERQREVEKALPRIDLEARETFLELGEDSPDGLMLRLRDRFHAVGTEELQKTLERLKELPPEQRDEVEHLVRRILNKLLHSPTTTLKEASRASEDQAEFLEAVNRLFKLK